MRRLLCLITLVALTLSTVRIAFASNDTSIEPRYMYTGKITASLSLSGSTASAAGRITPSGEYETRITVCLQKGSGTSWTTIATWNGNCSCGSSEAGGIKTLTKGYDYRVAVTGRVYNSNGTLLETVTKYSLTKTY